MKDIILGFKPGNTTFDVIPYKDWKSIADYIGDTITVDYNTSYELEHYSIGTYASDNGLITGEKLSVADANNFQPLLVGPIVFSKDNMETGEHAVLTEENIATIKRRFTIMPVIMEQSRLATSILMFDREEE